ncbi:hypothetical protein WA1_06745 [Scytonema hofmannii PCC 7110]|uniref:GUN4-like domain-containing protein n=1 Tax=Scytonema hofmannii PCC 7110 TaxID=128403 RepID=A0A139WSV7_9CYAN|nr:GUN4 domain-containing protein [Scytonema hofmannii]KYC35518.1 hypothetical protein WA1_06745 [Scytonema hofmannii PCC 7110]
MSHFTVISADTQNGTVVLVLALLGASIVGLIASKNVVEANNQVAKEQEKVTKAQNTIKQLEENEKVIDSRARKAVEREKNAIKNQQSVQKELETKKALLVQADTQRKQLDQKARELKIKAEESNQELVKSNNQLTAVENSRQELEATIIKIRRDKERFQQEFNKTQEQYKKFKKQVVDSDKYLQTVEILAKKAGELEAEGSDTEAKELFSQAGQSVNIKDHKLRQAVLYAGISYAYQKLKSKDLKEAEKYLEESQQQWKHLQGNNSNEASQIHILTFKTQGNLFKEQDKTLQAINAYKSAYNILINLKLKGQRGNKIANVSPSFQNMQIKILSKQNIEALHREFITLLSQYNGDKKLKSQVEESLKEHYLDELNNFLVNKKWQEADRGMARLMFYVANREEQSSLNEESIKNFSCQNLQEIDSLWVKNSGGRFGFSVQKQIWLKVGRPGLSTEWTNDDEKAWRVFVSRVGWYDEEGSYLNNPELFENIEKKKVEGILPLFIRNVWTWYPVNSPDESGERRVKAFFSRVAICKL